MPGPVATGGGQELGATEAPQQQDPWARGDPWSHSVLGASPGASPGAPPGASPAGGSPRGDAWSAYRRHGGAPGGRLRSPDAGQRDFAEFDGWELDAGAAKWMRRLSDEQRGELLKGMREFKPNNPSAFVVSRAPRYVAPEDDRPPPLRGAAPGAGPRPSAFGPDEPRAPQRAAPAPAPAPAAPRERTASPAGRAQPHAGAPLPDDMDRQEIWRRYKDADQRIWWWCEGTESPAIEGQDWFYEGNLDWRRSRDGAGRVRWDHEPTGRFFYDPPLASGGGASASAAASGTPGAGPSPPGGRPEPGAESEPGPAPPAARCGAGDISPEPVTNSTAALEVQEYCQMIKHLIPGGPAPVPGAGPRGPAGGAGSCERSPWEPCGASSGFGAAQEHRQQPPRGLHDSPGAMSHWDRERHRWLEVLETLRQRWQDFAPPQDFAPATAPQGPDEDNFGFCDRVAKALLQPKQLSYLVGTVASPAGAGLRRQFQRLMGQPAHQIGKVEDHPPGAQLYFLSSALSAEPGRFAHLRSDHWWPVQREVIALARELAGDAAPRDVSSIDRDLEEIDNERRRLAERERALLREREQALRR